jgi:hypothetical protein
MRTPFTSCGRARLLAWLHDRNFTLLVISLILLAASCGIARADEDEGNQHNLGLTLGLFIGTLLWLLFMVRRAITREASNRSRRRRAKGSWRR